MGKTNKQKIDSDYLELLRLEILRRFPGKTIEQLTKILGIGPTAYHSLFKNKEVIPTLNTIVRNLDFISLEEYLNVKPHLNQIKTRLLSDGGHWVSYCFSSRRRLYVSGWSFKKKKRPNSEDYYIEAIRDSIDYQYKGELIIDPDLSIRILVQTNPKFRLEYFTIFPEFSEQSDEGFYSSFKYMEFDVKAVRKKERFSTLEILEKVPVALEKPIRIEHDRIPAQLDTKTGIPTNSAYLAYNYLTRNVSKARRIIDNYSINQERKNGSFLEYEHNIFISCPIAYVKDEKQYQYLRDSVEGIITSLKDDYGFKEGNIFCEVAKYKHLSDIKTDRHLYFQARQHLRASHFICIIPESLGNISSSIYMEIHFRILKKLSALIFLEKPKNLPSLLTGVLDSIERPVNVIFKDKKISEVEDYLRETKEYLLDYSV